MTTIGPRPPSDGKSHECQCARCGSSCDWRECEECEDGFIDNYYDDDVDDEEYGYETCGNCEGYSGWWTCLASGGWCDENPLPGREGIKRGEIEWFETNESWG